MRLRTAGLQALVLAVALFFSGLASAQRASVAKLAQRLKESADFRVRTQAALALGASKNRRAVGVLCSGLADRNTTVRAASAAALGRLALGGKKCLRSRLQSERNAAVRSVIRRALDRVGSAGEGPRITSTTKYYVAIGDATNKTSRTDSSLNSVVRRVLKKHLGRLDGFVLAPAGETGKQAKQLLARYPGVKAIFVWPKINTRYSGGALRLHFELSLFTYPGKAFKGSIAKKLTMPGTQKGDEGSENDLMEMAAERLSPDLARTAARI